jgi:hypothetical protein
MEGCHRNEDTSEEKISTARSSEAARSQTQRVVGESSTLVARREDEASKEAEEPPVWAGSGVGVLVGGGGAGGATGCVIRVKVWVRREGVAC